MRVMTPAINQTSKRSPAEPTERAISELTIKIPDPIIEPITIIVESNNPSSCLKEEETVFLLLFWDIYILIDYNKYPNVKEIIKI